MKTFQDYLKEVIAFVNSLTIKIDEIRKQYNFYTYILRGELEPPIEKSKYYINLAGEIFNDEEKPIILDLETNEYVEFSQEYLNNHPSVKEELLKYSKAFNNLINLNRNKSVLIRGILNPIPLDVSIEKDNYSILYYKKDFLAENERGIVLELEKFIKMYMATYHNRRFMIDELYLPGVLINLFNALIIYTLILKLKNALTNQVDEYHLELYLMSYKHIYKNLDILDKRSKIWLYGNLAKLKHYIGRNYTLNKIVNNLLDQNNIGIGELNLIQHKPEIISENIDDYSKPFYKKKTNFFINGINKSFNILIGKEYGLEEILFLEKSNNEIPEKMEIDIERYKREIDRLNRNSSLTKALFLDHPIMVDVTIHKTLDIAIPNILELLRTKNYLTVTIVNSVDKRVFNLTAKDIEYLIVYLLYKNFKLVSEDFTIYTNSIIDFSRIEEALNYTIYKDRIRLFIDTIREKYELKIDKFSDIQKALERYMEMEYYIYYIISNIEDPILKTDLRNVISRIFISKTFNYNIVDIENYIKNNGLENLVFGENYSDILREFLKRVFDTEIDIYKLIEEKLKNTKTMLEKLTSYNIQFLIDFQYEKKFIGRGSSSNIYLNYKPILNIRSGYWRKYLGISNKVLADVDEDPILKKYNEKITIFSTRLKQYRTTAISPINSNLKTITFRNRIGHRSYRPIVFKEIERGEIKFKEVSYIEEVVNNIRQYNVIQQNVIGLDRKTHLTKINRHKRYSVKLDGESINKNIKIRNIEINNMLFYKEHKKVNLQTIKNPNLLKLNVSKKNINKQLQIEVKTEHIDRPKLLTKVSSKNLGSRDETNNTLISETIKEIDKNKILTIKVNKVE